MVRSLAVMSCVEALSGMEVIVDVMRTDVESDFVESMAVEVCDLGIDTDTASVVVETLDSQSIDLLSGVVEDEPKVVDAWTVVEVLNADGDSEAVKTETFGLECPTLPDVTNVLLRSEGVPLIDTNVDELPCIFVVDDAVIADDEAKPQAAGVPAIGSLFDIAVPWSLDSVVDNPVALDCVSMCTELESINVVALNSIIEDIVRLGKEDD